MPGWRLPARRAPAGAPSRPVVISRSPPLAGIVKWAALLARRPSWLAPWLDLQGPLVQRRQRAHTSSSGALMFVALSS